ncbi:MAG: HU family DNA-binding protein [Patescibacteria group bacterium]|nr:HU family DNA-binding protein [Patescibacteria group bacterium]
MNKTELVEAIANKGSLTKKDAENAVNAFEEVIIETLKSGVKVTLTGFGTFEARSMKARNGVNPQTGAKIQIPARTVPKFKAGKSFKDAIRG